LSDFKVYNPSSKGVLLQIMWRGTKEGGGGRSLKKRGWEVYERQDKRG